MFLDDTTVSYNSAQTGGGGIALDYNGEYENSLSTISDNTSETGEDDVDDDAASMGSPGEGDMGDDMGDNMGAQSELDFEAGVAYLAGLGVSITAAELEALFEALPPPSPQELTQDLNITEAQAETLMNDYLGLTDIGGEMPAPDGPPMM